MAFPEEVCHCDLLIHVNGHHSFFLHQKVLARYSGRLRKDTKNSSRIEFEDFPGGPDGFELVSRFCYSGGETVRITVPNVSILHCAAAFLEMTEKIHPFNLFHQTQIFLEGIWVWSWHEILSALKSCEPFFDFADSCGLITRLMDSLVAKIFQNPDISSSSSSSSSCSYSSSSSRAWWFEDMTVLPPRTIEKFLGYFGKNEKNSATLTKFLLHYLKRAAQSKNSGEIPRTPSDYSGIAERAVQGVILRGKTGFSCRSLFWVLRIVSGFGVRRDWREKLERLIGGVLEKATLDDLLVCGQNGNVYDVNLVVRLIRLFIDHNNSGDGDNDDLGKMKKMIRVGRLVDRYLGEISPDQSLRISKFLAIAESLPDDARDCFDGVYRAIDIYLESHPTLSFEERSRICRCLNYEKLSLEACKELAKNPRIPPTVAVQALTSQRPSVTTNKEHSSSSSSKPQMEMVLYNNTKCDYSSDNASGEKSEDLRLNLQRMQWRVVELEKVCKEMKGQMTKMVKTGIIMPPSSSYGRSLPRLC